MFNSIRKLLTIGALALSLTLSGYAAQTSQFPHREIENWHNQGMTFVIRDAQGHIMAHAKGHLEKWKSEQFQVWVVRDAHGRFLTYLHGALERWTDGSLRIVLRDKTGKFVAVGTVAIANGKVITLPEGEAERMLEAA